MRLERTKVLVFRRAHLGIAAGLAAVAVILAVSGGFRTTVGGLRISARSPLPIAMLALASLGWWYISARRARSVAADLEAAWDTCQRHSKFLIAIALLSAATAAAFSTRSAAGADASGYLSEAAALSSGRLFHVDDLAEVARGHDPYLTSPLGWRPAGDARQAPTYPPGLPMLMAIPHALFGITGAAAVVILCAGIAVVSTGLLAAHLAGSIAGVIAASLIAFTPVFVLQAIQPMSDVPVTAFWMLCFVLIVWRAGSLDPAESLDPAAGVACAIAVLIRPNLAPLAIVPLLLARRKIAFSIPVAVAGIGLAWLQWSWYGSPFRSGYGSAEELFSFANIVPNSGRYVMWMFGTAPVFLLSVFGLVRLRADRMVQGLSAFAGLVVSAYLVYAVFDHWSYLRFILPAMAVFAILTAAELAAWIDRRPTVVRPLLLLVMVVGFTAHALSISRSMETFRLADQVRRVPRVADLIEEDVPPAAVLVAGEQSGSMRYYTDRPILRWEAASPGALASATAALEQSRRPVYIVLDAWEEGPFRAKFAAVPAGALDWPPILDAGTSHRTRLWKLSDRERFLRGENLNTIRLP